MSEIKKDFVEVPNNLIKTENGTYIEFEDGHWFFYDETYDKHGPFLSQGECLARLDLYCQWLDNPQSVEQMTEQDIENYVKDRLTK